MALRLKTPFVLPNGTSAEYYKLTSVSIVPGTSVTVGFAGYLNESLRRTGATPVHDVVVEVPFKDGATLSDVYNAVRPARAEGRVFFENALDV